MDEQTDMFPDLVPKHLRHSVSKCPECGKGTLQWEDDPRPYTCIWCGWQWDKWLEWHGLRRSDEP